MARKSRYSKMNKDSFNVMLVPLILVMCVVPLIVHMYSYNSNATGFDWYSSDGDMVDFFLYYKSFLFTVISFSLAVVLFVKKFLLQDKLKFDILFAPLLGYAVFIVLSALFSEYKYFSINGIFEHFETVFVLLGYCLVVYYAYVYVNSENDLKIIVRFLLISVAIIVVLGLTQYFEVDFFKTVTGRNLIASGKYREYAQSLSMTFPPGQVYLTLYNPNYVGLYVSIIVPLLFVLTIFSKNIKMILVYIVLIVGMLMCLIGSGARNGMVAIPVSALFIIILLRKRLFSKPLYFIMGCIIIVGGFILTDVTTNHSITDRFKSILAFTDSLNPALQDISTNEDNVIIKYNDNVLKIKYYPDGYNCTYEFFDENDNDLTHLYDYTTGIISDDRFSMFVITPALHEEKLVFGVNIDGVNWYFTNQEDGTYHYINGFGKYDKIVKAKTAVFSNHETMGSSRGFIWARTIPLLKNTFIIGTGPDTFSIAYPQNDYVSLYNYGLANTTVDKPHNMYLQIGVQTGVLSLIALLVFYGMYFVWSIRLYFKNDFISYSSQIGVGIFIGSIGYMISGLFNDSNVCVSPMFWALIGVGIAANSLTRKG